MNKTGWVDKICGKCRYHKFVGAENQWVCIHPESEKSGLKTEYDEKCQYWGSKG